MQRLLDTNPEINQSDSQDSRVAPRLDRKKVSFSPKIRKGKLHRAFDNSGNTSDAVLGSSPGGGAVAQSQLSLCLSVFSSGADMASCQALGTRLSVILLHSYESFFPVAEIISTILFFLVAITLVPRKSPVFSHQGFFFFLN